MKDKLESELLHQGRLRSFLRECSYGPPDNKEIHWIIQARDSLQLLGEQKANFQDAGNPQSVPDIRTWTENMLPVWERGLEHTVFLSGLWNQEGHGK